MPTPDPWIDPDNEPLRRRHLEPLVEWIRAEWDSGGRTRLLDYGCGDLLLASMLGPGFAVDGYDPSDAARRAARRRAARGDGIAVHDRPEQIPTSSYDGVVLSSVVQYLEGPDELRQLLQRLAPVLVPGAHGVLATDLPVPGGRRVVDGWDVWRDLSAGFGPVPATREVLRSARRSPGRLWTPDPQDIDAACRAAGFDAVRLAENLSTFTQRATLLLRPVP